jgi:hypothetical protein
VTTPNVAYGRAERSTSIERILLVIRLRRLDSRLQAIGHCAAVVHHQCSLVGVREWKSRRLPEILKRRVDENISVGTVVEDSVERGLVAGHDNSYWAIDSLLAVMVSQIVLGSERLEVLVQILESFQTVVLELNK